MEETPAKRSPGRPRDPGKRTALLAAARALFLERGSDAVTMDLVIARAGVSRATLYSNFADRGELLAAVIRQESERFLGGGQVHELPERPVEERLTEFGTVLLRFIADAETLAVERLVIQAARTFPEHGTRFFEAGPGQARAVVETIIRAGQERGQLCQSDPELAANDLLGLWLGFWRVEMQFGCRATVNEAEVNQWVRHGVKQFLKLYS